MAASHTGEGGSITITTGTHIPVPDAPWTTVTSRFDNTLAMARDMLELMVGEDGASGYLGQLNSILVDTAPTINISALEVDPANFPFISAGSAPAFDDTGLTSYPNESYSDPNLLPLPAVDTSVLVPPALPDSITPGVSWIESAYSSGVYNTLLARLLNDLVVGATGLDVTVEQAIYDRGIARNQAANAAAYQKVNDDFSARRFSSPSGALAGALADLSADIVRQETDLNNQIIVSQGDLAQKNSQFIIAQAVAVEQLLIGKHDAKETRAFEHAKVTADMLVRYYAEGVKLYLAQTEAQKNYVQAQAENLRATIDANKGAVDIFKARYEALATRINAVSQQNRGVVDVFVAEMQGFGETTRALSSENLARIEQMKAHIENARLDLEAQIKEAEVAMEGYKTESLLKETVSKDLAQVAQQALASTLSSVNASAGISYSGQESLSETIHRSVSISEQHEYANE